MNATTGTLAAPAPTFRHTVDERGELSALIDLAAQIVAPLWPLDSAIAVNPLSGFEDSPFEQAIGEAAGIFGARGSLPLKQWRQLMAEQRIDDIALRKACVTALGGLDEAFALLGPDVNAYDLLRARLCALSVADHAPSRPRLAPGLEVLARWLAAFFDRKPAMPLKGRERGLYACLTEYLAHDPALLRLADRRGLAMIAALPADPLDLIRLAMAETGVPNDQRFACLRRLLASLPGWASHLRWRIDHGGAAASAGAPATMAEFIALVALVHTATPVPEPAPEAGTSARLVEIDLLAHFGLPADAPASWDKDARRRLARVAAMSEDALGLVFQMAAEASYLAPLLHRLEQPARAEEAVTGRPDAQLVFCIDVRSEPMRRAIESAGSFETFGYAGFFGLPIAIEQACNSGQRNQLPVLLSPAHVVAERAVPGREAQAGTVLARRACLDDARHMLDATKSGPTGFAAAEAVGPLAAVAMLARTLAPRLTSQLQQIVLGERKDVLAPACHDHDLTMTLEQKVGYARGLFTLTGLPPLTARLVVLVGHGGSTTNNAFAASLDCGACGGHPGGPNARLMASILNDPCVRKGLAENGLVLPFDTVFVAAQHDTTRDMVTIFDRHLVPSSHAADLDRLAAALERAGRSARQERSVALGRPADDLITGAVHWGEVRPEWGLSGNAAFLVGPRALTHGLDLGGTAFLHSYDWRTDEDGSALTTIMTAPMIVAQWINAQYLFSTIDNHRFGAGDKVTHNVVAGIGVVQGAGGDLCTGLPRQSLFRDDGMPFHIPRRLAVIIEAPLRRVQDIVLAHDQVGRLVENGWVNLVVVDPWKRKAHNWTRGEWVACPS